MTQNTNLTAFIASPLFLTLLAVYLQLTATLSEVVASPSAATVHLPLLNEQHVRVKRIVGGQQAKPPPVDDPVIFTRAFNRDARVEGFRNQRTGIYSFLGMHYAEPPTGDNRYARPVYKRIAGDINATRHGPPCIQPDPYQPQRVIGDENCLLLNVYTPQMPDESTGLPVYVWIHPGGFRYGSAAQYDATPMAQKGVIVVAPQYRLGSLGIIGDGTKEFDGNLAMFDMATALRWVNDYIAHFGGDPKQVKAIGHGSGAASAMYLSMSRNTRSASDVTGVVAMSGTALSQYATDKEPVQSVQEVAAINGCPLTNELEIIHCLRRKSAEDIIKNDDQVQTDRLAGRALVKGLSGHAGFQPHVESEDDGRALPSLIVGEPDQQLRNGNFTPIPLLTGVTKHETAHAFSVETIERVFGSAEKFLGSLTDALSSLTSFLRIDSVTGEVTKAVLPGLTGELTPTLNDVLRVPETLNLDQVLSKVTEATTDILFNLPAVLTSQVWSQVAPAFMYSFEYNGSVSRGINFLRGLPIVSDTRNTNPEVVAHGDELGYMFDANDIFGNPLTETRLTSDEDLQVRDNLIDMLVKFAKTFREDTKPDSLKDTLFRTVTGKGVPFIKVDTALEPASDFRFCELSVMGASLTPLTSTTCQGLGSLLAPVSNVVGGLTGTLGGVTGSLGQPLSAGGGSSGGGGAIGGLLGSPPKKGSGSGGSSGGGGAIGGLLSSPPKKGSGGGGLLGGSSGLLG